MGSNSILAQFHFHNGPTALGHGASNGQSFTLQGQTLALGFASDKLLSGAFGHLGAQLQVALGGRVDDPQGVRARRLRLVERHLEEHGQLLGGGSGGGVQQVVGDDADGPVGLDGVVFERGLSRFCGSDAGRQRVAALSTFDVGAVERI